MLSYEPPLISSPHYEVYYDQGRDTIRSYDTPILQSEKEATDEFAHFMDRVISTYEKCDLPERAESAQRFFEHSFFVRNHDLQECVEYFSDELVESIYGGEYPIILHTNALDDKDRQVGSSEYIVGHIYESLHRRRVPQDKIPFCSIEEISHNRALQDRPLYVFDDWIISGGQMSKLVEQLSDIENTVRFRFVALRENWTELATSGLSFPQGSLHHYYQADAIRNAVEGPSIIGAHSSANIGWQNRIATFGYDLSYIKQRPVPLPTVGDITRRYRTRVAIPKFYRQPPEADLLSWRCINGVDPDGFTEFTLETIAQLLRSNRSSHDKTSI